MFHKLCEVSVMKKSDVDRFIKEYAGEQGLVKRGPFTHALGINPEAIVTLHELIFNDFDQKTYGIGWWKNYEPSLDWKQRVLISDQLFKCVSTAEDNLIDLHLHFLEAQDCWEKYNSHVADSVTSNPDGKLIPNVRPPNALADLNINLTNIHIAGFFRAVGSIADCLAGAIVGVVGLRLDLKRADLERTRKHFQKEKNLTILQKEFGEKLEAQIQEAGPDGWLSWAMQHRNMMVHRARRFTMDTHMIYSLPRPSSNSLITTKAFHHLVLNPELSDIEALVQNDLELLLGESAETTMRGILGSLQTFLDSCVVELAEIWKKRKADPFLIPQPAFQWREAPASATEKFAGYSPALMLPEYKEILSSGQMLFRMKSASLDRDEIKRWKG